MSHEGNESVLLKTRPGFAFVFLYRQGWWLIPPVLMWLTHAGLRSLPTTDPAPWLSMAGWIWLLAGLLWRIIAWWSRQYILTDRRVLVRAGVISRVGADVPLKNVQHTTVTQSVAERLLGLGTIGVATAGSDGAAINWLMVKRPVEVMESMRKARESTGMIPRVIGLAGGIGSGKSEAARVLSTLGCVVIDSDQEAKQALDRSDVREQLVKWWGPGVLKDGRIDRKAVADIVFKDPDQRTKLEGLVHPIVRTRRAEARARAGSARAVVIDAPLLFEAGVDKECDAVIFVDTPRDQRLARVKATRGWDEPEVLRREAGQLPVDEKRRRATEVVSNAGTRAELGEAVRRSLERILAS